MKYLQVSDWACIGFGTAILVYEILCPRGQYISDAVARYRRAAPVVTYLTIATVAGHLAGITPRRFDLLARLGALK
ncbi:DUF7427 family protein [Mycobacteroides abscessus]